MAKAKKRQPQAAPGRPDQHRIESAMEAAGQIQVLSKLLLRHVCDDDAEMDRSESATIMIALAGRCASLAASAFTLLADDDNVRPEDIAKICNIVFTG